MKDLGYLKKLLKLCREQGVESIRFEGIELHLGALPQKAVDEGKFPDLQHQPLSPGGITEDTKIDMPDALNEEQMMFYSSGGNQ